MADQPCRSGGLALDHKLQSVAIMALAGLRIWVGAAVTAAVLGMTVNHTHAQTNRTVPLADVRIGFQAGGFVSTRTDGILIGLDAAVRMSIVELGVLLQAGGELFADNASSVAATGGVSWQMANGLRLHLLGICGARYYGGVGADGLFGDDPGASAVLGYAGATGGASYRFRLSNRRWAPMVGVRASLEEDLARVTREYSYVDDGVGLLWGDGEPTTVTQRRSIGATRGSLVFSGGFVFDL